MEGGLSTGDSGYDITSTLKDTEDLNDELFGALKKGSKNSKKLSASSKDDGGKKKMGFGEFDDSDPLGDISLSDDDDFYGIGDTRLSNKINPTSSILTTSVKEEPEKSTKSAISNLDKPSKSKLIADLFGLDESETTSGQPIAEKKKSDWLGIKESPKKSVTIIDEADKSQTINSTLEPKIKKPFPEFKSSTEKDKHKIGSEKEGSSVTKIFSRDDEISNLLTENKEESHEKMLARRTSADKKKDITDELFGKTTTSKITDARRSSTTVAESEETRELSDKTAGKKTEGASGVGQYLPSSGSGRRTGFGRRRDGLSSAQLGSSTEITTARKDDTEKNWLFGVDDNAEKKGVQSAPLPTWLGGQSKTTNEPLSKSPEKSAMDKDKKTQQEESHIVVPKAKSAPILKQTKEIKQGDRSTTNPNEDGLHLKDLLSSSSVLDQNNSAILQQTESGLLAAVQMKQQKDVMAELVSRQANILRVQEQQMNQLMEQQARRQQLVEINMKKQQERINALLQALLTESGKDAVPNVQNEEGINYSLSLPVLSTHSRIESSDEDDDPEDDPIQDERRSKTVKRSKKKLKSIISKLEIEVHKLGMEKATFEQRLEIQESRHNDEIKIIEKFHRHEISSWEEREEQLKQRLTDLKTDYDERITQLHDQQEKLIQQHNVRIDNLQKEKMEDLKQLGEFHRLAMDQVANISKILLDDSRLIEKKKAFEESRRPMDTTELSTREAALINRENEISALKDSLEKQRLSLIAEKDRMEDKLDQEKRTLEENNRQLRKQQSALKYREEEFQREQEREKDFIKSLRKQVEELKENALREQKIAMEERLQITANQARLDALAKLQGQESSTISCIDIIQAKGEMEGALAAAKEVRSKVEEDKQKIHQQQINLEAEKWRLQELETELANKQQHIEHLIKLSEAQRKEGFMALEEAKLKEKRAEERLQEAELRLQEVAVREKKMMKEKLEMTKERAILEKKRSQLDFMLPNLTQSESSTLGLQHKAFIDPRNLIMRLKAEKELETG